MKAWHPCQVISLLCFVVGLTFLGVFGILRSNQVQKERRCGMITTGKVVEYVKQAYSGDSVSTWRAVFEYTAEGSTYRKVSSYGTGRKVFAIGQAITVHYNLNNPNEYYVDEMKVSVVLQQIFSRLGVGLVLIGIVLLLVKKYYIG